MLDIVTVYTYRYNVELWQPAVTLGHIRWNCIVNRGYSPRFSVHFTILKQQRRKFIRLVTSRRKFVFELTIVKLNYESSLKDGIENELIPTVFDFELND